MEQVWKVSASIRVCLYDALDHAELGLGPHELEYVDVDCGRGADAREAVLHVYNHTVATGTGFHFDALLDASVLSSEEKGGLQTHDAAERRPASGTQATTLPGENADATPKANSALRSFAAPGADELQRLLQAGHHPHGRCL